MTLADHALTMALYHRWACERLLDGLAALDEARYRADCGLFFRSIHGTLNHGLLVDRLWRGRVTGVPYPAQSLGDEVEAGRVALAAAILAECDQWIALVRAVPAVRWEGELTFRRLNGEQSTQPLMSLVMHVFNHGTHHRGQVTAAMTQFGLPAPELDLAYFLPHRPARVAALPA